MKNIEIIYADADLKKIWAANSEWQEEVVLKHMHLENGFTILAKVDGNLAGMVSVYWKVLGNPIPHTLEGYIDILEVAKDYRRQGVATKMLEEVVEHARQEGAYQIRAWSSDDKFAAIQMWRALDFILCPATTYPNGNTVHGVYVAKKL